MGRYADVHAALTNWQGFESGAGVGMSNFNKEEPWRPPSLLLEADPPYHDAPRAVLAKVLGPRSLRRLRAQWEADADDLVEGLLETRPSTPCRRWPRPIHCGSSPTPWASRRRAGSTCSPTVTTPSTRSGRPTTWSRRGRTGWRSCPGGSTRSARARCSPTTASGRRSGRRPTTATSRPSRRPWWCARCSPRVSTPRCTPSPRCCTRSPRRRVPGTGCAPSRDWPEWPSTRPCASTPPCRPSSAPPPPTSRSAVSWCRRGRRS